MVKNVTRKKPEEPGRTQRNPDKTGQNQRKPEITGNPEKSGMTRMARRHLLIYCKMCSYLKSGIFRVFRIIAVNPDKSGIYSGFLQGFSGFSSGFRENPLHTCVHSSTA
jgi:hypothetical protein